MCRFPEHTAEGWERPGGWNVNSCVGCSPQSLVLGAPVGEPLSGENLAVNVVLLGPGSPHTPAHAFYRLERHYPTEPPRAQQPPSHDPARCWTPAGGARAAAGPCPVPMFSREHMQGGGGMVPAAAGWDGGERLLSVMSRDSSRPDRGAQGPLILLGMSFSHGGAVAWCPSPSPGTAQTAGGRGATHRTAVPGAAGQCGGPGLSETPPEGTTTHRSSLCSSFHGAQSLAEGEKPPSRTRSSPRSHPARSEENKVSHWSGIVQFLPALGYRRSLVGGSHPDQTPQMDPPRKHPFTPPVPSCIFEGIPFPLLALSFGLSLKTEVIFNTLIPPGTNFWGGGGLKLSRHTFAETVSTLLSMRGLPFPGAKWPSSRHLHKSTLGPMECH